MKRAFRFTGALALVIVMDAAKPHRPRWLHELADVAETLLWFELVEFVAGVAL